MQLSCRPNPRFFCYEVTARVRSAVFKFRLRQAVVGSAISQDLETINAAIRSAQAHKAEQILLALSWADTWRRDLICERLRVLPLPVLLLPDQSVTRFFHK